MKTMMLVGFPNSGKSTIFNMLTGQLRKVSNYSGVTVDSAKADFLSNTINEMKLSVVDLPGIFSLVPTSLDEGVTTSALIKSRTQNQDTTETIMLVLDLDRFEASLSLLLAVREITSQKIIAIINKNDHLHFTPEHTKKLSQELNIPIFTMSALNDDEKALDYFIRQSVDSDNKLDQSKSPRKLNIYQDSSKYLSNVAAENYNIVSREDIIYEIKKYQALARSTIQSIYKHSPKKTLLTQKIDYFMLHKLWGSILFFLIFYFIFNSIYSWAGPAMDFTEGLVTSIGDYVSPFLPDNFIRSLIVDGVFAGVGGVVIFLPQIMILFFLLSLLEQSGYISRAAVLTDKLMSVFGLNGKAFLPYMSGFACSIPAIMAARSIPNEKERAATIMTIPMITCSARLPVYVLLIGTFIPKTLVFGFLNSQALAFFFLYFLGTFFALIIAKIFRLTLYKGETGNFIIDLPHYEKPSFKFAFKQSFMKGKTFLKKAGTIILGLSILIWFLSSYPGLPNDTEIGKTEEEVSALTLENSYLGKTGKFIEPALEPMGMNWKMGVGLLVAFGARELFVSTLGTIYALGEVDEDSTSLRERLTSEINPTTGKPVFNTAVAWSILIFFVFALQCISTLAILRKEMGSWKYPLFMFVYMGGLGYVGATLTYQFLK